MSKLHTTGLTEPVALKNLPTIRQAFVAASSIIIAGYIPSLPRMLASGKTLVS